MQDLQKIFDQVQEARESQKKIKKEYRDALSTDSEYKKVTEELKDLRDQKKQIEIVIQEQLGTRYAKLEELDKEIKELSQMLSDVAISSLISGKSITIKDKYDNNYEPNYKVNFKKANP